MAPGRSEEAVRGPEDVARLIRTSDAARDDAVVEGWPERAADVPPVPQEETVNPADAGAMEQALVGRDDGCRSVQEQAGVSSAAAGARRLHPWRWCRQGALRMTWSTRQRRVVERTAQDLLAAPRSGRPWALQSGGCPMAGAIGAPRAFSLPCPGGEGTVAKPAGVWFRSSVHCRRSCASIRKRAASFIG